MISQNLDEHIFIRAPSLRGLPQRLCLLFCQCRVRGRCFQTLALEAESEKIAIVSADLAVDVVDQRSVKLFLIPGLERFELRVRCSNNDFGENTFCCPDTYHRVV